jgi:hypothetical protein
VLVACFRLGWLLLLASLTDCTDLRTELRASWLPRLRDDSLPDPAGQVKTEQVFKVVEAVATSEDVQCILMVVERVSIHCLGLCWSFSLSDLSELLCPEFEDPEVTKVGLPYFGPSASMDVQSILKLIIKADCVRETRLRKNAVFLLRFLVFRSLEL